MQDRPPIVAIAAGVAVAFGLLTIVSGGLALFGGADVGAVVPFVLRFNAAAGFAYVAAGVGLWRGARWAAPVALGIAVATGVVSAALAWHVWQGGAYEPRTLGAMALRLAVWAAIAAVAVRAGRPRRGAASAGP